MSRFVFFGTASYAVSVLDALRIEGFSPSLVVTTPDTPKGRGLFLAPSPVKQWAQSHNISFIQPKTLKKPLRELQEGDFDIFIVAAYGKIIPKSVYTIPPFKTVCVHPSLLPRWRGPAPVPYTILSGDAVTGVSILEIDDEVDHGPILAQKVHQLHGTETARDLDALLWVEGGTMLADILRNPQRAFADKMPQDHTMATFSKKIEKADAEIPQEIILGDKMKHGDIDLWERKVRAYFPAPLAFSILPAKSGKAIRVQILKAQSGKDHLVPILVKPEGKREMSWTDFVRGNLSLTLL